MAVDKNDGWQIIDTVKMNVRTTDNQTIVAYGFTFVTSVINVTRIGSIEQGIVFWRESYYGVQRTIKLTSEWSIIRQYQLANTLLSTLELYIKCNVKPRH